MSTTRSLDREERAHYDVPVLVRDGGRPARWAVAVVRVVVADDNDHAPRFGPHFAGMRLQVPENGEPGPLVPLSARDADAGENGRVTFHIVGGNPDGAFAVDTDTGLLSTARPLDREAVSSYELRVEARDQGSPARSQAVAVSVAVTDDNDHAPAFPEAEYRAAVPEDAPADTVVLRMAAADPDIGANAELVYWLEGAAGGAFWVEGRSGTVRTRGPLDRETRDAYRFVVMVSDSSPSRPRSASVTVTVMVTDVNDNAPVFLQELLEASVSAASPDGQVLGRLQARDADYGPNAAVLYRVQDPRVTVDSRTGELRARPARVGGPPAWEPVVVTATDQGSPPRSAAALLLLTRQQDSAGPALRFSRPLYPATVLEHAPTGTIITTVEARYQNGSDGRITYSIVSSNNQNIFQIDSDTGAVSVHDAVALDYEASPRLRTVVSAATGGGRAAQAFAVLDVTLTNVNDHEPLFQHDRYVAFVHEQSGYGTDVATVLAEDRDDGSGQELVYSIPSGEHASIFQINRHGNISTITILDHEITAFYRVVVWAVDQGSPPLTGSTTLSVFVVDTNDNTPTIPRPPTLSLPEDTEPGSLVTLVTANDVDSYPALEYGLAGASGVPAKRPRATEGGRAPGRAADGPFGLARWQGSLLLSRPLDRERAARHSVSVLAWDGQHAAAGILAVLVTDVNDNAPAFERAHYKASVAADSPEGTAVARVAALDPDAEENGRVSYRVVSASTAGFSVDPLDGSVVVAAPLQVSASDGVAWLVVEARDGGRPPLSATVPVFVGLSRGPASPPALCVRAADAGAVSVSEDGPRGTVLTTLAVETASHDGGAGVAFSIAAGDDGGLFAVDALQTASAESAVATGSLLLRGRLDFETKAFYDLTVVAFDGTGAHGNASVSVRVTDVNDNPPVFGAAEYRASASEGLAPGAGVARVAATDADSPPSGGTVRYSISSGNERGLFGIGESSGAVSLLRALDRERQERHNLSVVAWDGAHAAVAVVVVVVDDVNDNPPFFPAERLYASAPENEPAGSLVTVLRAVDHDAGPYGTLSYSVLNRSVGDGAAGGAAGAFALDAATGELRTLAPLDREAVARYAFEVRARDPGGLSATVGVVVSVAGVDEFDPAFTEAAYHFTVPENAQAGESVGAVSATDNDGGLDGIVLYYLKYPSVYFGINETTGNIYLKVHGRTGLRQRRFRRDAREVILKILAKSPLPESRVSVAVAAIDVTHTAIGMEREASSVILAVGLAVGFGLVFAVVLVVLLIVILIRRKRRSGEAGGKSGGRPSQMDLRLVEPADVYRTVLPHYSAVGPALMGPDFPDHSAHSHSSGRGSAEGDAAADDEIRMITENPARGPHGGYHGAAGAHSTLRGPDSGIQHDADHLSDISHVTHLSSEPRGGGGLSAGDASGLRSPLAGVADERDSGRRSDSIRNFILQTLQQAERAAAHGGGREAGAASRVSRGSGEDGRPPAEGALASIVASEEELRGSYDWDYLLNWSPRFQPLAGVFAEIGRLKDETAHGQQKASAARARAQHKPRVLPPPLITNVVPPGTRAVAPRPVMSWTSIPRSPISRSPLSTSHAMSPSLTPSLSPLATRSPVVSPFVTSQPHGPTAVIFGNGQSPDGPGDDPEMHI